MKKLILLLGITTLISCTCLPQIPPQYLYADGDCQAQLPNYLEAVSVLDNCEGATLTQEPLPGTLLDAANPYVQVKITATDISGNTDIERFDVLLFDTIPPEIIIDSAAFAYDWNDASKMMSAYHEHLGREMHKATADSVWLDAAEIFDTQSLLMVTSPGFGGTSMGSFIDPGKYIMPLDSGQLADLGYYTIKLQIIDPMPTPIIIDAGIDTQYFEQETGTVSFNYLLNLPAMYESERYGDFTYRLPIGPGRFEVELYFAEIYWDNIGERIFDVKIQDEWVLEGYDIVADVGARRVVVKTFNTVTTNGWLDIKFLSKVDYAKVSGIVIRKTGTLAGI